MDDAGSQDRATSSPPLGTAALLVEFLRDRDVPCPNCHYNLRDQTTDRCPECGGRVELHLRPFQELPAAVIIGLIALAGGLGFGVMLLGYFWIITLRFPGATGMNAFFAVTGGGIAVFSTAIVFWLRHWRAIQKSQHRSLLVAGCYILVIIDVVLFSFSIR